MLFRSVHRDTLEQLAEILSVFPLQSIKCPDNAGRGVVSHWHNDSCPCQHKQRPLGTYRTHYTIHFPVPKRFPVVNLVWPVLDALPTGRSGCFPFSRKCFGNRIRNTPPGRYNYKACSRICSCCIPPRPLQWPLAWRLEKSRGLRSAPQPSWQTCGHSPV